MSIDELDLQHRLDAAIGDGPAMPPIDDLVGAGRRVVRRRRARAGSLLLATAAVLTVAVASVGSIEPGGPKGTAADVPTAATVTPTAPVFLDRDMDPVPEFVGGGQAFYDVDGVLVIRPGAVVSRRVDNPGGVASPSTSVGLVTTWQGTTYWTYSFASHDAYRRSGTAGAAGARADEVDGTFEEWLADEVAREPATGEDPAYVAIDDSGALTPLGDTVVLEQTQDVPASMLDVGGRGSIGVITVGTARLCVAARTGPRGPEYAYLGAHEYGPDLAGCVATPRVLGPQMMSHHAEREAAYVEFVTARRPQLRRTAYALCGDWDRADDLVQNALIKLYAAWPRVRRDGEEDAYVRRIVFRAAIDESRRPWRRERATEQVPDIAAPTPLPLEDRDALLAAVQALPEMQRVTVLLRHWLGLSVAETAADLGIGEGTVKSHTSRALAALERNLDESNCSQGLSKLCRRPVPAGTIEAMSHLKLPTLLALAAALIGSLLVAAPAQAGAAYEIPTVGACHTYSYKAAVRRSESSTPVACTGPHTAQTIAVIKVRSVTSPQAPAKAAVACSKALKRALGPALARTAYTYRFFLPTKKQARKGARWVRCDVVLAAGRAIAPLPTPLVTEPVTDAIGLCAQIVRGVTVRTVCAAKHDYRYTAGYTAKAKKYPGRDKLLRSVILTCAKKVSTPKRFWAFYPDEYQWKAGRRDVSCLSRTTS